MAIKKEAADITVEQKLKNLYQLQTLLSESDKLKALRGELPLEVEDLDAEIEGLTHRLEKYSNEIEAHKAEIAEKNVLIEDAKAAMKRYEEQQNNVSNNREYDILTKEIEFQSLEIELCEKNINDFNKEIKSKTEEYLMYTKKEQPINIDCSSYQAFSASCCAIFSLATAIINLIRFSWLTSLAPASQSIIAMLAFG